MIGNSRDCGQASETEYLESPDSEAATRERVNSKHDLEASRMCYVEWQMVRLYMPVNS